MNKWKRRIDKKIVAYGVLILVLLEFIGFYVYYNTKTNNDNIEVGQVSTTANSSRTATPLPTPIVMVKEKWKKGKLLQDHTVYHYSDYNRDINLDKAAKEINGTILGIGEEFEFYKAIGGEPTEEKGYVKAGTIVNGKNVDTVGGGICEVATSLNTSIIDAGIPIRWGTEDEND